MYEWEVRRTLNIPNVIKPIFSRLFSVLMAKPDWFVSLSCLGTLVRSGSQALIRYRMQVEVTQYISNLVDRTALELGVYVAFGIESESGSKSTW